MPSAGGTTDTRTAQSKDGRRFSEKLKRDVTALAKRLGTSQEQVARDPGVGLCGVSRWKKLDMGGPTGPSLGVSAQGLERENEELRQQRSILK